MAKEVKPKLWEAIVILLLMLVIMGIGIIELHLTPVVPILMVILLLIFWGKLRGFSWDDINDSFVMGVKNGIIPLFIFLLIVINWCMDYGRRNSHFNGLWFSYP